MGPSSLEFINSLERNLSQMNFCPQLQLWVTIWTGDPLKPGLPWELANFRYTFRMAFCLGEHATIGDAVWGTGERCCLRDNEMK